jgi:hypothetical protein
MNLVFTVAEDVYADPCEHVVMEPRPGRSIDDLAVALQRIPGVASATAQPAVLGGRSGQYLELSVPGVLPCDGSEFWMFGLPATDNIYWPDPGATLRTWILETVDGQRLVIVASQPAGASEEELVELERVVQSLLLD